MSPNQSQYRIHSLKAREPINKKLEKLGYRQVSVSLHEPEIVYIHKMIMAGYAKNPSQVIQKLIHERFDYESVTAPDPNNDHRDG